MMLLITFVVPLVAVKSYVAVIACELSPEITPVTGLRDSPAGSSGSTCHVTAPGALAVESCAEYPKRLVVVLTIAGGSSVVEMANAVVVTWAVEAGTPTEYGCEFCGEQERYGCKLIDSARELRFCTVCPTSDILSANGRATAIDETSKTPMIPMITVEMITSRRLSPRSFFNILATHPAINAVHRRDQRNGNKADAATDNEQGRRFEKGGEVLKAVIELIRVKRSGLIEL